MNIQQLSRDWEGSGLEAGDTVLIHSDIQRTARRYLRLGQKITPQDILKSFLEVVGSRGTVLFPLFNFDFTKGVLFDIRHTPSHMGVLTECARQYPGSVRTGHPIYSFAVIGAEAGQFRNVNNFSGYGTDSPFAMLRQMGGKIASLNLSEQLSMTFYHHVEEMLQIPTRYHKVFTGPYAGWDGIIEARRYGLFVRDLEKGVQTHVNPAGELMWQAGLYRGSRPNEGSGLRVIESQAMFDFISNIIKSGRAEGLIYRIELRKTT